MKKLLTKIYPLLILLFLAHPADSANMKMINTQEELTPLITKTKNILAADFNIFLRLPIKIMLLTGSQMEEYQKQKGIEIGLYSWGKDGHEIRLLAGMNEDDLTATLAHEMTHAWQRENCTPAQGIVIQEGFARWVEYKVLDKIGAYIQANNVKESTHPTYRPGFIKMCEWEDEVGAKSLVQKIRKVNSLDDNIKNI